jgi:hypothetical protein
MFEHIDYSQIAPKKNIIESGHVEIYLSKMSFWSKWMWGKTNWGWGGWGGGYLFIVK